MTLVLSWFNRESETTQPMIWTVADTMISDGFGSAITLEGAKLLEVPIRCKDLSTPSQHIYYQSQIGFAYAGSSLRAFNCFSTLSVILTNLGGHTVRNQLPDAWSLLNIARHVLQFYHIQDAVCEICLYGKCPKSGKLFIGTIKPKENVLPLEFEVSLLDDSIESLEYVILGAHKDEVKEILNQKLDETRVDGGLKYWRAPVRLLNDIIRKQSFSDVGGNIQLNFVGTHHFHMTSASVGGEMKFRNIDIFQDLPRTVGDCLIAINGMDFMMD